ncbi:MAG: glutamine synthetase, partial [Clostridia bacterium]|nr:glutamine synthetase [Clostridia bacterium]
MENKIKNVMKMINDNDIKMVDFKMVDINGHFRHVTIPAENFSEDTMKSGIGFDASNYGYAVVE